MRLYLMIFSALCLASCGEQAVKLIVPDVPAELRQPVTVPERKVETLADIGVVLTDHVEALDTANGRIKATDCILREAEAKAGIQVPPCADGKGEGSTPSE